METATLKGHKMTPSDLQTAIAETYSMMDAATRRNDHANLGKLQIHFDFLLIIQRHLSEPLCATLTPKRTEESYYRYYDPDCVIPTDYNDMLAWQVIYNGKLVRGIWLSEPHALKELARLQGR